MMLLPDSRKAIFRGAEQRSWDQVFLPQPKALPSYSQNMHDSENGASLIFKGGENGHSAGESESVQLDIITW